jgi:hypothetical protein
MARQHRLRLASCQASRSPLSFARVTIRLPVIRSSQTGTNRGRSQPTLNHGLHADRVLPGETADSRDYRRKKLRDFGMTLYALPDNRPAHVRTCHCPECEAQRELVGFQRWVVCLPMTTSGCRGRSGRRPRTGLRSWTSPSEGCPSQALIDENLSTLPHSHLFVQNAIRCALVPIRAHLEDYEPPVN